MSDSMYGQLKEAKTRHGGGKDFVFAACSILTGSIIWTIILALFLAIPISAIVIGAQYLDDCPAERYIPIYLIVFGSFSIVKNISSLIQNCRRRQRRDDSEESNRPNPFDAILNTFLFAWFIAGNVWVYRLNNKWVDDDTASNYCHPTLYYYAFWLITSSYIIAGACCLIGCIIVGIMFCCSN